MKFSRLKKTDSRLYKLIISEIKRQNETINLIASENFAAPEILEVLGSPLTNKYSEGYPGKRYYPGNFFYDEIEKLARERALKAYGLSDKNWSVNVQPYSGSSANLAVYLALMKRGDVLMGMSLASGGHLTHGHKISFSGKLFKPVQYGVGPDGLIDYQEIEKLAKKHRPKIIVSGASAYPRKINFKKIGEIAKSVGAYHLADISHIAGLIAAGLHQSPFSCADIVTTTTHKTLKGPRGAVIFANRKSQIANHYKVNLAEAIDKAIFPGLQGGPHNNVIAAVALAFGEMLKPKFKNYQRQIVKNAEILAKELKNYGFNLAAGGTDNHLLLIDLKNLGIGGLEAEKRLERAGIIANRNSIFGDASPYKPSGLRLGTPAATARGMKEKEMKKIAAWINALLVKNSAPSVVKKEVLTFLKKHAIY